MAAKHPDLLAETAFYVVSGTGVNTAYTVGDQGEESLFLLGVVVVDSTGSVATAATVNIDRSATNYVLAPSSMGLPTATENLELVCEPAIRLLRSDKIEVTGATNHHVIITYQPVRDGGNRAQR
jgi:hypothetical protein